MVEWNLLQVKQSSHGHAQRFLHNPDVVVVVTRPLLRDRGMVEDHGVAKEPAAQRVCSWTVQNEIEVSWDG